MSASWTRPGWSPDLTLRTAAPGDRYLICSDGLSGFASPDAIRELLASGGDADQAAEGLVSLAYSAGAPDNVTVIVADVPGGTWDGPGGNPVIAVTALAALWTMFREYKASYGPKDTRPFREQAARAGRSWVEYRMR